MDKCLNSIINYIKKLIIQLLIQLGYKGAQQMMG